MEQEGVLLQEALQEEEEGNQQTPVLALAACLCQQVTDTPQHGAHQLGHRDTPTLQLNIVPTAILATASSLPTSHQLQALGGTLRDLGSQVKQE